jgi:hypothetical protein
MLPRLFEIEIDSAGWKRRQIVNASGAAARTSSPDFVTVSVSGTVYDAAPRLSFAPAISQRSQCP